MQQSEPWGSNKRQHRKRKVQKNLSPSPNEMEPAERPTLQAGSVEYEPLTSYDLYLFNEGRHFSLYNRLGAHLGSDEQGNRVIWFSVWAPNATSVSVIGDFNGWQHGVDLLHPLGESGVWQGAVRCMETVDLDGGIGQRYKLLIEGDYHYRVAKGDPFAFYTETPPATASIVWQSCFQWGDQEWMKSRGMRQNHRSPISIYEMHLGSWKRKFEDGQWRFMTYTELAEELPDYLRELNFTHVEFLPVMEHPFYGSWGYQVTGYFAPTSRFGSPDDFKYLIDKLHQAGFGVILDWVPSHFPSDEFGLGYFDGSHLFEHEDWRQGYQPDWNSLVYNYGRNEVRSFLISNAMYWLDQFHVDGLRVDAVASMLYLDYSRKADEWVPNRYGGRENLEAINFLKQLNEVVYGAFPDALMIAEESTAWPMVSKPTYLGGLGFGMKWDMGWMHDTLEYFHRDPLYRKHHQNDLTFRMVYAFNENFVLAISHDEVVHGKQSLIAKMPGDSWQKFANLRCLLAYMYTMPGKKLLFMGCEFAQWREWSHDGSLDWHLLEQPEHRGIKQLVKDLNLLYQTDPALYERDFDSQGFQWVDTQDAEHSVLSYIRKTTSCHGGLLIVLNLTPEVKRNYRIGVPVSGQWVEVINTDAETYGGSDFGNLGKVSSVPVSWHGFKQSLVLTLPPLAVLVLRSLT